MADMRRLALLQKIANAEKGGNADQVKRMKERLKDFDEPEAAPEEPEAPAPSASNTKAELLEAAAAAGVEADDSMTKAEILEALDGA